MTHFIRRTDPMVVHAVIQIATLDSSGSPDGIPIPRVRSQIFRSFLSFPDTPSLPLLISSTDVRTPKVTQLITSSNKSEVVWWIEGTHQQFRFIANVYIVPEPRHHLYDYFLREVGREVNVASFKEVNWEKKRVELFRGMSEHMRASWCRPTPGTKLEEGQKAAKMWPEKLIEPDESIDNKEYETTKRLWDTALANFAIMVINPIEVDFIDLGVIPNFRSVFTKRLFDGGGVEWVEEEVVP